MLILSKDSLCQKLLTLKDKNLIALLPLSLQQVSGFAIANVEKQLVFSVGTFEAGQHDRVVVFAANVCPNITPEQRLHTA